MIGGRSLLRRARQRRVLSKHIKRSNSFTIETSLEDITFPSFLVPLSLALVILSIPVVYSLSLYLLYIVLLKLHVVDRLYAEYDNYRKRTSSRNGPSIRERCYYYLDYWISTNPYAKALVLFGLTVSLIFSSGTIISWMANEPWLESLWAAALGSGLDWGFINSKSASLRLVAVCTNVGGLVLTALLLSLISDAVQTKYDSLRKGESVVTENRHTLIIGWSVKSLSVMTQLAKAGESNGSNVIVCLTDQREKEDMENDIAQCDFSFNNVGTRVVCRSGSPLAFHELKKVSFWRAKSIIILGDDAHDVETNDARSLQILLSIVAALERERANSMERWARQSGRDGMPKVFQRPDRIVIEVMDTENAAIMKSVCPEIVEPVLAHDLVGRLLLQAARNPLVADIWQELLGFDGCEIYSSKWATLIGMKFKECLLCFEDAIPLGVKKINGDLVLNPPDDYIMKDGDEIIVLAEDDTTYCPTVTHPLIRDKLRDPRQPSGYRIFEIDHGGMKSISRFQDFWCNRMPTPPTDSANNSQEVEKVLFCGWRFDMGNLLDVFSAIAPPGSEFWILCELPEEERESALRLRGWQGDQNIKVVHVMGSCRRNILANIPLEQFTSVIVGTSELTSKTDISHDEVSESGSTSKAEVTGGPDARVITVVMLIQDIIARRQEEQKAAAAARNLLRIVELPNEKRKPGSSMSAPRRSSSISLSRARSMRFLGQKNNAELYAPRGVVVGEIVDSRSRAMLAMVNAIDAVVASSELISKAVAMVSEDTSVNRVLNTLFDPYDSEITLEGVERYVNLAANERVSFFELLARGRKLGTIVLGYLIREEKPSKENPNTDPYETIRYTDVALNPAQKDLRRDWHPDDLLIVLTPGTGGSVPIVPVVKEAAKPAAPAPAAATKSDVMADTLEPGEDPADFLEDIASVRKLDLTGEYGRINLGDEAPEKKKGKKGKGGRNSMVRFGS